MLENINQDNPKSVGFDIFFSEKYNMRLVTTGRELIDLKENLDISKNKSLIVANPAFNLIEEKNYNQKDVSRIKIRNQIRSISLSDENWMTLVMKKF